MENNEKYITVKIAFSDLKDAVNSILEEMDIIDKPNFYKDGNHRATMECSCDKE